MHSMDEQLIVFARYPEVGQVKTRLAEAIGPEPACALYRFLVQAVLRRTCPRPLDTYQQQVCFAPESRAGAMSAFLQTDCGYSGPMSAQAHGDLGARMEQAFARAFAEGAR